MKKIFALILAVIIALGLAACGTANGSATDGTVDTASDAAEPVVDQNITAEEATGDFAMTTSDGTFTSSGNVYTITSAGTYTASGLLEGQIIVDAGEDDEVVIELSGATVNCGSYSPIKIISAGILSRNEGGKKIVLDDLKVSEVKE